MFCHNEVTRFNQLVKAVAELQQHTELLTTQPYSSLVHYANLDIELEQLCSTHKKLGLQNLAETLN